MGYVADHVEPFKFLCYNCGGKATECCDGFMGKVPLCCSETLYTIEASTNILNEAQKVWSESKTAMTCQSNDQCPEVAGKVAEAMEGIVIKGDYCCPIINSCCEFNDYIFGNLEALSYSFGGPIIFGLIIVALLLTIIGCCCCCCCCCCCRRGSSYSVV
ncbi:uncharacterized protein LOC142349376 isoform X2 [Convolutriloba macropyga]